MPTDLPFYTRYADGFRIGDWNVWPRSNELSHFGEIVHVEPKPMHVLTLLAEHAGETVTREALLEAVWPEVYVTENALSRCISQLRKVLNDDARNPQVIETIPTVGYRLVSPVYPLGDGLAVPGAASEVALSVPAEPPAGVAPDRPGDAAFSMRRGPGWVALGFAVFVLGLVGWLGWADRPASPEPTTRPLTSLPGREVAPALSPDESRVAYVHMTEASSNLYVRVLGTGGPLQLTSGPARDASPAWAPDGRTVAFVRCEAQTCYLYSIPALGGEARRLDERPVAPWGIAYAPGGQQVFFSARPSAAEPFRIEALDLSTRERSVITAPPSMYSDLGPVVSPDGAHLLFRRQKVGGSADLYRLSLVGGESEQLTHDSRSLAGYDWTPDSREILFSSNRTGMYELWRIPSAGGAPARVDGIVARDPGRPAVGEGQLVFEEWAFEVNLWEAGTDSTSARSLVVSTWWDKHPHLSRDGAKVAFISNRSGPPEVWTAHGDGSSPAQRTNFDGASVEAPRWSPDGQRLVFQVRLDTQADLYVMDAEGGAPHVLTPPTSDEVLPRWSRDGQRLYFGSNRDGQWQLWSMPAEGGEAVRITDAGGIVGEESADGTEVLFAKYGEPGLWARPIVGGPERTVTDELTAPAHASWAVTDRGVIFPATVDGTPRFLLLDLRGGTTEAVGPERGPSTTGEPGLTASLDGRRIVFAQVDRVESDLMVASPFE